MPQTTLQPEVSTRYQNAVESLLSKVRQDPYVLAMVLYGSLSYDVVWDKSDIDVILVTQETRLTSSCISLVEDGINIHTTLLTRSEFKKQLEGAVQGSFAHSMLMRGQLLYTRDESLEELWANRQGFGIRDREIRLLEVSIVPLMGLTKAQKWLVARKDPYYSFFWIMKCLDGLANIETILAGEIPGREVLWQALRINPTTFQPLYTDLIDSPKTLETVGTALERIESYLRDRTVLIFRPVLEYLSDSGGVRSAREIDAYFRKQIGVDFVSLVCEWLAEEGIIQQAATPARLTDKSRIDVEEVAYYYDGTRD